MTALRVLNRKSAGAIASVLRDTVEERVDQRLIPIGDRTERLVDHDGMSPEQLLIAKEELLEGGLDEDEEPVDPRLAALHQVLEEIPAKEREAVVSYFGGRQTQQSIAAREQLSQPGVQYRIERAIKRLRWVAGPGSWFTERDIRRDLRGDFTREEVVALTVFWTTSSQTAVQKRLGYPTHNRAWRLLRKAIERLEGRYREGFDRLLKEGKLLLAARPTKKFSALRDFFDKRVEFLPEAKVALTPLALSYERHALSLSLPWSVDLLRTKMVERGARPRKIRVPWARGPVSGFEGARLRNAFDERVAKSTNRGGSA